MTARLNPDDGIAIVTGAGSGLGRALTLELANAGFKVAAIGRRRAALEETRSYGGKNQILPFPLDVSRPDQVVQCFDQLGVAHGPIAMLINNAAICPQGDFLGTPPQSFMDTVDINLGGMIACTHAALHNMVHQGRGRILNVTSVSDFAPPPGLSAYAVSKGAGRLLTKALIADLADRFPDIIISDWSPGLLNTRIGARSGEAPELAAKWGAELAQRMDCDLMGSLFRKSTEILPEKSFPARFTDTVLRRKIVPRSL